MSPLRAFVTLCSSFILVTGLLFLGLTSNSDQYAEEGNSQSPQSRFKSFFSFRTPDSLFTPAATISLTDDNSTFFAARPAAFGPPLPTHGLSGQVWIGNGFGDDSHIRRGLAAAVDGELGCGDIPGWSDSDWSSATHGPHKSRYYRDTGREIDQASGDGIMLGALSQEEQQDGTDDHLHYPFSHTSFNSGRENTQADPEPTRKHPSIKGKVALLSRGGCGFSEKIQWAQRRGASAVIVGDNQRGGPLVRMYARNTVNITIPSLFTSHMTAHLLSSLVPHGYQPVGGKIARRSMSHDGNALRKSEMAESAERESGTAASSEIYGPEYHDGLWVTLLMTDMTLSPFFNTLFVLVVSPLITLAIVYIMLLVRARIRRRRWRAPKSVVERLPVRIYHVLSTRTSSSGADTPRPPIYTPSTPLLVGHRQADPGNGSTAEPASDLLDSSTPSSSSQYGSLGSSAAVQEKVTERRDEWRRRHGGKQVECSVCLEEYEDGISKVMSLPCGHDFHADCITPWLTTRRRTCPICKGDVVRSIAQTDGSTSPSAPLARSQRSQNEDIQVRAAETTNTSPWAALPVPRSGHGDEPDLERGGEAPSTPPAEIRVLSGRADEPQHGNAAPRAADASRWPSRQAQSLPERDTRQT